MTGAGVIWQHASHSVLQCGKGRAGEGGLNLSMVQTNLLLEPEEHEGNVTYPEPLHRLEIQTDEVIKHGV